MPNFRPPNFFAIHNAIQMSYNLRPDSSCAKSSHSHPRPHCLRGRRILLIPLPLSLRLTSLPHHPPSILPLPLALPRHLPPILLRIMLLHRRPSAHLTRDLPEVKTHLTHLRELLHLHRVEIGRIGL